MKILCCWKKLSYSFIRDRTSLSLLRNRSYFDQKMTLIISVLNRNIRTMNCKIVIRDVTEIVWSRGAQATGPSQNERRRWCRDECNKGQDPVSMALGRFCTNIVQKGVVTVGGSEKADGWEKGGWCGSVNEVLPLLEGSVTSSLYLYLSLPLRVLQ